MDIIKFSDFINEDVKIPVVDILIDIDGNVYNGSQAEFPLRKGNISQISKDVTFFSDEKNKEVKSKKVVINDIVGSDSKSYPLGVDKNGYLVYPDERVDENGYVLNKDRQRIPISDRFLQEYNNFTENYWRAYVPNRNNRLIVRKIDYSFLLPLNPTGWVNVKVDMEVLKRVRRYALSLGNNNRGHQSFISKLKDMEEISSRNPDEVTHRGAPKKRDTIQKEMSVIILLHYINEIKDFFTPGSAGFIFESFLAGLIPNSKVIDDNGSADIIAGNYKYQIKLYSNTSKYISANFKQHNDYYVICVKNPQDIEIFIVNNSPRVVNNVMNLVKVSTGFKLDSLRTVDGVERVTLSLSRIEEKIESIGMGLKSSLDSLYGELSKFQYNVETIITGVNDKGEVINDVQFNTLENSAGNNVDEMKRQLTELVKSVDRRKRH